MDISIDLIRKLREETNYGMMDCKKALIMTENDMNKAKEYLKEREGNDLCRLVQKRLDND